MLFEVPPSGTAEPDPRLVYLQTMLGAIEMLKAGVTAVHDDAFHIRIRRKTRSRR